MQARRTHQLRSVLRSLEAAKFTRAEATEAIRFEVEESLANTAFRGKVVAVRLSERKREGGRLVPCNYAEGDVSLFVEDIGVKQSWISSVPAPEITVFGLSLEFEDAMSREKIVNGFERKVADYYRRTVANASSIEADIKSITLIRVQLKIVTDERVQRMSWNCGRYENLVCEALGGLSRYAIAKIALQHDVAAGKVLLSGEAAIFVQDVDEDQPFATNLVKTLSQGSKELDEMVREKSKGMIHSIVAMGECSTAVTKTMGREAAAEATTPVSVEKFLNDLTETLLNDGPLVMPQRTTNGQKLCFKANAANKTVPTPLEDWESFEDVVPVEGDAIDIRQKFSAPYGFSAEALYTVMLGCSVDTYEEDWNGKKVYVLFHPLNNPYKSKGKDPMAIK